MEPKEGELIHASDHIDSSGELLGGELIVKPEVLDGGSSKRGRDGSGQVVVAEPEILEGGEAAEEMWDGA